MKKTPLLLSLITLLITTPHTDASIHAVENFGLENIEISDDTDKTPKDIREGFRLSKSGLNEQAFKMFTTAAKRGELTAYLVLGVLHREGRGTPKNLKLAKENFKKAAAKGSSQASEELELLRFASPDNPEEFAAARTQIEKFARGKAPRCHTRARRVLSELRSRPTEFLTCQDLVHPTQPTRRLLRTLLPRADERKRMGDRKITKNRIELLPKGGKEKGAASYLQTRHLSRTRTRRI
ncbi:MAG: hypothetical protein QNL01_00805 [Akkermansiaceae bacterium]